MKLVTKIVATVWAVTLPALAALVPLIAKADAQLVHVNKAIDYRATNVRVESDGRVCFDLKALNAKDATYLNNIVTTCSPDSIGRTDIDATNARIQNTLAQHPAWLFDEAFLSTKMKSHTGGYIFQASDVVNYLDGLKSKVACNTAGEAYRDAVAKKEPLGQSIEALKSACL